MLSSRLTSPPKPSQGHAASGVEPPVVRERREYRIEQYASRVEGRVRRHVVVAQLVSQRTSLIKAVADLYLRRRMARLRLLRRWSDWTATSVADGQASKPSKGTNVPTIGVHLRSSHRAQNCAESGEFRTAIPHTPRRTRLLASGYPVRSQRDRCIRESGGTGRRASLRSWWP